MTRFIVCMAFCLCMQSFSFAASDTINLTNKSVVRTTAPKPLVFRFDPAYDVYIEKYAAQRSLDPYLIKCIIKVESDFNPRAVSVAGAAGLMQLMQETAREYGVTDRADPDANIRAGTMHFGYLMRELKGDVPLSLAAYHAGYGRVKRAGGIPPIKSTIDYVNQVMRYYAGGGDFSSAVKRLYRSVDKEGTIHISDR